MIRPLVFFSAASLCTAADLTHATVVAPANLTGPERKAVALLVDSVRERTRITWPVAAGDPGQGTPVVRIARSSRCIETPRRRLSSRLLRKRRRDHRQRRARRTVRRRRLAARARNAPRLGDPAPSARRHHRAQIPAARPSTRLSSEDQFLRRLERARCGSSYIRDLAVFGTNAIELIPPRSDDAADSPHFPLPPMQMMIEMSRLAQEYGLRVWIWYPAMDPDYSDPATVEAALKEWGEVFRQLPRIDAVFVPGGDPGHTAAEIPDGAARKADRESPQVPPQCPNVGLAARLQRRMDGRVLRT